MGAVFTGITSIFSTVLGVAGSLQQGSQNRAMANYQAQVARNNQAIAEQNARDAIQSGKANEQRQRMINSQRTGAMRASAAASGFDVGSESFLDEFAASDMTGEMDALNVRNDYQRQANNYWRQAADFGSQAGQYTAAGRNSTWNSVLDAGSSILGGASLASSAWGSSGNGTSTGGVTKFPNTKPTNKSNFRFYGA